MSKITWKSSRTSIIPAKKFFDKLVQIKDAMKVFIINTDKRQNKWYSQTWWPRLWDSCETTIWDWPSKIKWSFTVRIVAEIFIFLLNQQWFLVNIFTCDLLVWHLLDNKEYIIYFVTLIKIYSLCFFYCTAYLICMLANKIWLRSVTLLL